jgi:hypothetical protein
VPFLNQFQQDIQEQLEIMRETQSTALQQFSAYVGLRNLAHPILFSLLKVTMVQRTTGSDVQKAANVLMDILER